MRRDFLFLCAVIFLSFSAIAENYYIGHVGQENWTTSITVYNDGSDDLTFDLQRWDHDGTALTTMTGVSVPANSSTALTNADFGYDGTALVVTPLYATLVVKLSYRYQDSHSLCEFFIPQEHLVKHWMLPNPYQSHFDWFGAAVANFSGTTANVTLTAWHNGTVVGTSTKAIAAHTKVVDVSSGFWAGVNYADVDMVTMDSDVDIPAPVSITGNTAQDRHVFFLAENEEEPCSCPERVYAIPHVAESNWTTKLTAYNNGDIAQSFTFSSWNKDGTDDVAARVVSVPAHGSASLTAGTDFVYGGTASIVTNGCMHFKLLYQYGTSQSLCEFFLGDSERPQWFIPNSIHDWFNWFGVAFCNPTDDDVIVTLDAYKDGLLLGTSAKTLAPHTKTVGLSSDLWPDITAKNKDAAAYSDVDMVVVRSSAPIPKPLSITGNTTQDRHVFFLADQDAFGTEVPDKNFWNYLLENFDTDLDGALSASERDVVYDIDTPGTYSTNGTIRDITGISMFPNLQDVDCNFEDLFWLPPELSGMTTVRNIRVQSNHLVILFNLDLLTNLHTLNITGNHLVALPNLSTLSYLNSLSARHNNLSALPELNGLINLTTLDVCYNSLATLPDISSLTKLVTLETGFNHLTHLPDLSHATDLQFLGFGHNEFTSFPDISALTNLISLDCSNNQFTALPDMSSYNGLQVFYCQNNQLTAIPGLASLSKLYSFDCSGNQLTSISDVSGLTTLQYFLCSHNLLTSLPDLSALTSLIQLNIDNNPINQIPGLAALTSIQTLQCNDTLITDFSAIAGIAGLYDFECNNCPVSSLSCLSGLNNLGVVTCDDCLLTDIPDVTSATSMFLFWCFGNNFGSDDCPTIQAIEAMGLTYFAYNPQKDGSILTCP